MALNAMPLAVEVGFARRRIAHQDRFGIEPRRIPCPIQTVQKGSNGGDAGGAQVKFRHAPGLPTILHNCRDDLAVLIGEYHGRAQQIWSALAAACVRAMTEAAVDAEDLLAARQRFAIARRLAVARASCC